MIRRRGIAGSVLTHIFNLNSTNEPLGVRRHLCLCGFGCDETALDVHTPWGETPNQPIQLPFSASLKFDFQGSRVTSDGSPILVRELDERQGLEKRQFLPWDFPVTAEKAMQSRI